MKAVHFTAMNEHRENFSLTKFPGSLEKEFPGVHCDIGGAYESGMEVVDEIETSNHKPLWFLNNRRQHLIDEHWFKDEQIEINNKLWNALTMGTVYRKITGKRFLRKEYSYIPLHFMQKLGENYYSHQIILPTENTFSIESDQYLPSAKNYLYHYVFENGEQWNFKTDEQVKLERELKETERLKAETTAAAIDNVYVKPRLEVPILLPESEQEIIKNQPKFDENGNEIKTVEIEGVTVTGYSKQTLLRILRNKYLHWSANRDWLGMDPNSNYERQIYYQKIMDILQNLHQKVYRLETIVKEQKNIFYLTEKKYVRNVEIYYLGNIDERHHFQVLVVEFEFSEEDTARTRLLKKVSYLFDELELTVDDSGNILTVENLLFLRLRWAKIQSELFEFHKGEPINNYFNEINSVLNSEAKLIEFLSGYKMFGLLFNGLLNSFQNTKNRHSPEGFTEVLSINTDEEKRRIKITAENIQNTEINQFQGILKYRKNIYEEGFIEI